MGIKKAAFERHVSKVISCRCKSSCKRSCSDRISIAFQESVMLDFWGELGVALPGKERKKNRESFDASVFTDDREI